MIGWRTDDDSDDNETDQSRLPSPRPQLVGKMKALLVQRGGPANLDVDRVPSVYKIDQSFKSIRESQS